MELYVKERMRLTNIQQQIFEEWVVEHLYRLRDVVPDDEGNQDALIYNLVQAIRGSRDRYKGREDQDAEISTWHLDAFQEDR